MEMITLTYQNKSPVSVKKEVSISFENPKNVHLMLDEILAFLKAIGYTIRDDDKLKIMTTVKFDFEFSGIKQSDFDYLNDHSHGNRKAMIGPDEC